MYNCYCYIKYLTNYKHLNNAHILTLTHAHTHIHKHVYHMLFVTLMVYRGSHYKECQLCTNLAHVYLFNYINYRPDIRLTLQQ